MPENHEDDEQDMQAEDDDDEEEEEEDVSLEGDDSLEDTVSGVLSTGSEVISISGGGGGGSSSSSSSSSDHTATDIETANAETKLREQLVIHRRHLFKMCSFQSTESVKTPLCSLCSLPAAFRCFSCGNGEVIYVQSTTKLNINVHRRYMRGIFFWMMENQDLSYSLFAC